jgi:hypothetical protein
VPWLPLEDGVPALDEGVPGVPADSGAGTDGIEAWLFAAQPERPAAAARTVTTAHHRRVFIGPGVMLAITVPPGPAHETPVADVMKSRRLSHMRPGRAFGEPGGAAGGCPPGASY